MTPLSEKCRPNSFDFLFGQSKTIEYLSKHILHNAPTSLLLYGPPGCGKTTIARIYGQSFQNPFLCFTAVIHGIGEIKQAIHQSQKRPLTHGNPIIFIDEIHRFNKSQQDIFLPFIENGTITLIGATTENPSFFINNALLSRIRTLKLSSLSDQTLLEILTNHLKTKNINFSISTEAQQLLIQTAHGDARYLYNLLEDITKHTPQATTIDIPAVSKILHQRPPTYDKNGTHHFDHISALHKSIRGSDPDAALYYFTRMIQSGEDPNYLARRLISIAYEDIGLADPNAPNIVMTAWDTYNKIGPSEGNLALSNATLYLALAPKSNAAYLAFQHAQQLANQSSHLPPPSHICHHPPPNHNQKYCYDHDYPHAFSGQNYFPSALAPKTLYTPNNRGFEREMKKRCEFFNHLKTQSFSPKPITKTDKNRKKDLQASDEQ